MTGTQTGTSGDIWSGVGAFRYFQGTYLRHLGGNNPGSRLITKLELYVLPA